MTASRVAPYLDPQRRLLTRLDVQTLRSLQPVLVDAAGVGAHTQHPVHAAGRKDHAVPQPMWPVLMTLAGGQRQFICCHPALPEALVMADLIRCATTPDAEPPPQLTAVGWALRPPLYVRRVLCDCGWYAVHTGDVRVVAVTRTLHLAGTLQRLWTVLVQETLPLIEGVEFGWHDVHTGAPIDADPDDEEDE